ncbi:MAG: ComF family protein [Planctomycetota bacterium]|jgi:predicted amidophosphoribosyltransferase
MRSNRLDRRRLRERAARRLAAVIELLVGTTRPYGRALHAVIDEALDPRHMTRPVTPGDATSSDERATPDRDPALPRGLDSMVSLGRYADGLGSLVAAAKYEAWSLPLELLGRRLGVEAAASISGSVADSSNGRGPIIVPVPTCGWRRWHRGIDHTRVLAQGVAHELRAPIRHVLRCRWAPTQVELDGAERRRRGARFRTHRLAGPSLRSMANVLLVDDVCTTGATLSGVASLLRVHGVAEVHAVVVARGNTADACSRGGTGDRRG